jgi:ABC-type Zn uptake system ZnuABC Zn-binding protein ZnuA
MRTARSTLARTAATALVATLLLAAGGCGDDSASSPSGSGSVRAVATTTQVADLVREVGGERVDVSQLLQPSSDPHGYEPRPSDAQSLADADVVFKSGADLDEWLGDLIESSGNGAPTVELIQAVETIDGEPGDHGDEHDHGDSADPHWWQDPRNAIAAVAGRTRPTRSPRSRRSATR